jgi:hypothetical protein
MIPFTLIATFWKNMMAPLSGLKLAGWDCDSPGNRSLLCIPEGKEEVGYIPRMRELFSPETAPL